MAINALNIIIIALANIPLTLESGITFKIGNWSPAEATRIFMENSPFFISMTANGGIQLTNNKGQWITRTSPIVEAKTFDNGYCYFVTESGHKYQFTVMKEESFNPILADLNNKIKIVDNYLDRCKKHLSNLEAKQREALRMKDIPYWKLVSDEISSLRRTIREKEEQRCKLSYERRNAKRF